MAKIEISVDGGGRDGKILIDGHEIPDVVSFAVGAKVGEQTTAVIEIFGTEVTINGEAALEITTQVLDAAGMIAVPADLHPSDGWSEES